MKKILLLLIIVVTATSLGAQERVTELDTLFVVSKAITKQSEVNVGAKVEQLPIELLRINSSRNMAELLAENTSISVKSMGLGANATASFRGASAAQTRVNWNGVNITPVMAGIFDFSQMPVFFADQVALFHGGNDVKGGTGAVGGSINIDNLPYWDGATKVEVGGEYGSYHTYTGKVSARYGSRRFSGKSRAYYQHSDNDYAYINKVSGMEPYLERRSDARFSMLSGMQELHFRLDDRSFLSSALWYQKGERMLPQPLGVETTVHEKQGEQNIRAYLGYNNYFGTRKLEAKAAYIQYSMRYNRRFDNDYFAPNDTENASHTLHGSIDYSHTFATKLLYNTTLTYRHDIASARDSRDPDYDTRANRDMLSWHHALRYKLTDRITADGRVMGETVDWARPVFTYSVGVAGTLIPERLHLRSSVSYNYRQPSLNELYWKPGGNPDVLPEQGVAYDATMQYKSRLWHTPLYLSVETTGYLMDIDNWILWLPVDETVRGPQSQNQWLWRPQNKRDVRSYGTDLIVKLSYAGKKMRSSLSWNYSYTRSYTRTKQHVDDGALLNQIPYIPKQKWSLRLTLDYARAFVNFQTNYVGVRFITTDQSYFTYPYNVSNLLIGYHVAMGKVSLTPQLRIDNLFNTYYESTKYYPMPRRTVLGSLQIRF
ncbi:MAG: TonB-dependent receptor plug domain-containing protein [Porphyromonas sp.]|nr:TonB-dependent receptor plug domain-containing protein [Porphyromonas sp.]